MKKNKNCFRKIIISLFVFLFLFSFKIASPAALAAVPSLRNAGGFLKESAKETGLKAQEPSIVIGNLIRSILAFIGVIFLILMIYGGVTWMTAGGNEEKIKKAKGLITNATIGLVIILAAYSITWFITTRLLTATTQGT